MAIPEAQLATWSSQGATATAAQTYNSIKAALANGAWPLEHAPDIYLQGSYRNSTNIFSESDVDVVVKFASAVLADIGALTPVEQAAQKATFVPATYTWADGRRDTLAALVAYYGAARVKAGNKAIKVETPYRMADVVVAIEHHKYLRYFGLGAPSFESGIAIQMNNDWIYNFPQQHYDNGVEKSRLTGGLYKPTVRMFKNANRYMVERRMLAAGTAPSYGIECMVYSAQDDSFKADFRETFCNVVNWAHQNIGAIRRVSEQGPILGAGRGLWDPTAARSYIDALASLWNNWG